MREKYESLAVGDLKEIASEQKLVASAYDKSDKSDKTCDEEEDDEDEEEIKESDKKDENDPSTDGKHTKLTYADGTEEWVLINQQLPKNTYDYTKYLKTMDYRKLIETYLPELLVPTNPPITSLFPITFPLL